MDLLYKMVHLRFFLLHLSLLLPLLALFSSILRDLISLIRSKNTCNTNRSDCRCPECVTGCKAKQNTAHTLSQNQGEKKKILIALAPRGNKKIPCPHFPGSWPRFRHMARPTAWTSGSPPARTPSFFPSDRSCCPPAGTECYRHSSLAKSAPCAPRGISIIRFPR